MTTPFTTGPLHLFTTYAHPEIRNSDDKPLAVLHDGCLDEGRRLVACWNACKGIDTASVNVLYDIGGVPALEEQLREARNKIDDVTAQRNALQAQIDAAAAAPIGYTVGFTGQLPMWHEVRPTMDNLRKIWSEEIDNDPSVKVYALHAVEVPR